MTRLRDAAQELLLAPGVTAAEKAMAERLLAETNNKPRFEPLNDGVLVKVHEEGEKTKGGIILPEQARKKMNQGTVKAVGPGRILENGQRVPTTVKVGQDILFGAYSGTNVVVDTVPYTLMREIDVLGIMHGKALASLDTGQAETVPPVLENSTSGETVTGPTDADLDKAVADLVGALDPPASSLVTANGDPITPQAVGRSLDVV